MKKYLLLVFLLPTAASAEPSSFKRILGNILCFFITKKDVSEGVRAQVEEIRAELNPNQEISAVKKFNKIGEYFFGRCNSLSIPLLNYIVLNEGALKDLDDKEAQRFMIGRSLYKLGKPSLLLHSMWPFIYTYLKRSVSGESLCSLSPYEIWSTGPEDLTINFFNKQHLLDIPTIRLAAYLARRQEFAADRETAIKLECAEGGKKVLDYQRSYPNDDSIIGKFSTYVPDVLSWAKLPEYLYQLLWHVSLTGETPASIAYASAAIDALKIKNPLTFSGHNDQVTEFLTSSHSFSDRVLNTIPACWETYPIFLPFVIPFRLIRSFLTITGSSAFKPSKQRRHFPLLDDRIEELSYLAAMIKAKNAKREKAMQKTNNAIQ